MDKNITKTIRYRIRPFEEVQEYVNDFNCGNIRINNYLLNEACYFEIAKTYLFVKEVCSTNNNTSEEIVTETYLIGFFSLCADSLIEEDIIKAVDDSSNEKTTNNINQISSAIKIHMFAIDERYQKKRDLSLNEKPITYAHCMLMMCLNIIEEIVKRYLGATYIVLYSTKEGEGLYKYVGGFEELEETMSVPKSESDIKLLPMYRVIFEEDY